MGRGIKILVPCSYCKKKKYHTAYHERARGFVCKRCHDLLEKNPELRNLPFKGWVWSKPKEE